MKKTLLLIVLFSSYVLAGCGIKIPCQSTIESTKEMNIQILDNAYEQLNSSMDNMFDLENEYKEKLQKQNYLFNKIEILEKQNVIDEKNVLLLLKQNNLILDKIINIDLTEKIDDIEIKDKEAK